MLMCISSLKALFTPPRHSESFVHCVDVTHLLVFEGCSQDTSATIKDSKSSFRRRVIQQSASNIFQMFCTPECQEWFIFREDRASLRLSQIHTVSIQNEICSQIVSFGVFSTETPEEIQKTLWHAATCLSVWPLGEHLNQYRTGLEQICLGKWGSRMLV